MHKYGKKMMFGSLIVLAVVLAFVSATILFGDTRSTIKVFVLKGVISNNGGITPRIVKTYLDSSTKAGAVVLRVDSSGGSVVASQEILDHINKFKEENAIPVVVSMGEMAASGGYYISLGADRIVANPGTLTGSIGVISEFVYFEGLFEMLGIEREIVKSGKHKDLGVESLTDEQLLIMQELSDNIYEQFVSEIAERRGLDQDYVRDLATGEIFSGEQALELGLIDELGSMTDAIEIAANLGKMDNPDIKIKYPKSGAFDNLLGVFYKLNESFNLGLRVSWQ